LAAAAAAAAAPAAGHGVCAIASPPDTLAAPECHHLGLHPSLLLLLPCCQSRCHYVLHLADGYNHLQSMQLTQRQFENAQRVQRWTVARITAADRSFTLFKLGCSWS
jgi:hypothetical protein